MNYDDFYLIITKYIQHNTISSSLEDILNCERVFEPLEFVVDKLMDNLFSAEQIELIYNFIFDYVKDNSYKENDIRKLYNKVFKTNC